MAGFIVLQHLVQLGHSLKSGNFTFSGYGTGIQWLIIYVREFEIPVMFHRTIFSEVETS
jgi:hypothetical protein